MSRARPRAGEGKVRIFFFCARPEMSQKRRENDGETTGKVRKSREKLPGGLHGGAPREAPEQGGGGGGGRRRRRRARQARLLRLLLGRRGRPAGRVGGLLRGAAVRRHQRVRDLPAPGAADLGRPVRGPVRRRHRTTTVLLGRNKSGRGPGAGGRGHHPNWEYPPPP
eukprot:gene1340-biopygen18285